MHTFIDIGKSFEKVKFIEIFNVPSSLSFMLFKKHLKVAKNTSL